MAKQHRPVVTTQSPSRQMWRRSVIIMVILVGFCFSAVIGKLAVLQLVETADWQERAVTQQLSDSVVTSKRGTIYDANMKTLAASAEVWKLIMAPKNIQDLDTNRDMRTFIADQLAEMLGVNREKLYKQTGKTYSQYEVVKSKMEFELKEKVAQWILDNKLIGVFSIIPDYKRYYPLQNTLSNVLGFTGTDNTGLEGLEAAYNADLMGKAGRIVTAKNGWGDELPTDMEYAKIVDAEDGNSLVLTIDANIQTFAEKYLEIAVRETGCTNRGAVIIQDVNTGGILAMAIKGDYNPNDPFTVSDPDLAAQIAQLAGDEKSAALAKARQSQWRNKPLVECYEPGSVFKAFTSCMAIETKVADEHTSVHCGGSLKVKGWPKPIKCHKAGGHGTLDFPGAVSASCNPYFMTMGLRIGGHNFFKYFTDFGFTKKTGIDMLGEQSNAGLYHSEKVLSNPDSEASLATSAFGQTFKVTPLQVITAMSAVANGGKLMQPYVVQKIIAPDGTVVKDVQPTVKRQVVSADTSRRVAAMMAASVNGGGAKNAYVPGFRVAGKTGTSEKIDQKKEGEVGDVVASFSGFAPADNPQVAILVLLDEPQVAVGLRYGGTISAPVAQKVFASVLPYLNIETKYTEAEVKALNRTTPDLKDNKLDAAKNKLTNSDLRCQVVGGGDTVLRQVPEAGKPIPKEGIVVLYTEEAEEPTAKVPDFKGKTLAEANKLAADAGINLQFSGVGLENGEAKGGDQSVAAGTQVPLGTVVTVTFIYQDTIE